MEEMPVQSGEGAGGGGQSPPTQMRVGPHEGEEGGGGGEVLGCWLKRRLAPGPLMEEPRPHRPGPA